MDNNRPWRLALTLGLSVGLASWPLAAADPSPFRYVHPVLDGTPAVVANPVSGTSWAAWAYRSRGEFDLALSARDARGLWGPPQFLGARDGLDQVEPTLAVDAAGNVYLAFAVRETARVYLSVLPLGSGQWSEPVEASLSTERAAAPELRVVQGRLVLGYRVDWRVVLRDFPLPGAGTRGVQDGPDVLPPLGTAPDTGSGGGGSGGGGGGGGGDDGSGGGSSSPAPPLSPPTDGGSEGY